MTDTTLKALQHHVRKDEPKSVEERLKDLTYALEDVWSELVSVQKGYDKQIVEMANRIERLEGELSKAQIQRRYEHFGNIPFSVGDVEKLVTGAPIGQQVDLSGCKCPTPSWESCPVCDEEKE